MWVEYLDMSHKSAKAQKFASAQCVSTVTVACCFCYSNSCTVVLQTITTICALEPNIGC